jgi:arabinosaccharide transport system substrate-binding protein
MAPEERPKKESWISGLLDSFPPGRAMLFLSVVCILAFIGIAVQPKRAKVTLEFWTFAKPHYDSYVKILPAFHRNNPTVQVSIQLMSWQALHEGLQAGFIAGKGVPDLVEVEISRVGTFFAGPLEGIGFLDLTDRLKESGYYDRMVNSRFATYTSRGRIFGVPHDVHPLGLAYNRELFEKAGVNVEAIETWEDFIRAGRRVTKDLDNDGRPDRYAIELDPSSAYLFEIMLKQQEVFYFKPDGSLALDDPRLLETLVTYIRMAAGPEKIGTSLGGGAILTQAVMDGYLCALWLPDWRIGVIKQDIPKAAGMLRVMPLPAWEKGGRRVSTWGGTMMGISRICKREKMAWKLLEHLYFNPEDLAERYTFTGIVPPLKEAWDLPVFKKPEPYFGGQRAGELMTQLAPDTPRTQMTPFTMLVTTKMGEVVDNCVKWYDTKERIDKDGLRRFAREEIARISKVVELQMSRLPFYEP